VIVPLLSDSIFSCRTKEIQLSLRETFRPWPQSRHLYATILVEWRMNRYLEYEEHNFTNFVFEHEVRYVKWKCNGKVEYVPLFPPSSKLIKE
jgi:hypothetical protein